MIEQRRVKPGQGRREGVTLGGVRKGPEHAEVQPRMSVGRDTILQRGFEAHLHARQHGVVARPQLDGNGDDPHHLVRCHCLGSENGGPPIAVDRWRCGQVSGVARPVELVAQHMKLRREGRALIQPLWGVDVIRRGMGGRRLWHVAFVECLWPPGHQPCSSLSTLWGCWLAWAIMAVPACCRICVRLRLAVSAAKSASMMRPRAADWFSLAVRR